MRSAILLSVLLAGSAVAHDGGTADHASKPAEAIPVERTEAGAVYGAPLPKSLPAAIDIDVAAANVAKHAGKPAAYSGRITQVCQKMGCWLVLTGENGELARVSMHDHAFGVPKDSSGAATVYGTLSEKTLSAEEIEHLKKDGASAPAAHELQIDALSVLIHSAG
jgi:hypothetical protein